MPSCRRLGWRFSIASRSTLWLELVGTHFLLRMLLVNVLPQKVYHALARNLANAQFFDYDLSIIKVQAHEVKSSFPYLQQLVVALKSRMRQIVKIVLVSFALV